MINSFQWSKCDLLSFQMAARATHSDQKENQIRQHS